MIFLACSIRLRVMLISPVKHKICIEVYKEFPLRAIKKTLTPKSFAYYHMKSLSVEFFNTSIQISAGAEVLFSLRIKTFFAKNDE